VKTDYAGVYSWMDSVLESTKGQKVIGLSEMVVKSRLVIIAQLVDQYDV